MTTLLALGLGYSAQQVAAQLERDGWRIIGTARSPESLAAIAARGWRALPFDGGEAAPELKQAVAEATHILVSAPPGPQGDPALARLEQDLASAPALRWIGYLSTIGVYGDHGGAWVDEETEPRPQSARSIERLAAERAWSALAGKRGVPLDILRLSGIYGPGRSPLDRLLLGERTQVFKPGQVFNRIHVEDIAAAVMAGIRAAGRFGPVTSIYNVTDDEPAPPQDVTAFAAALLGLEPPALVPIEQAVLSPMAMSFYAENKRARNARMKERLGVALKYPTYREGLTALHREMLAARAAAAPRSSP